MAYDQRCTACDHHLPTVGGQAMCGKKGSLFFGTASPIDQIRLIRSQHEAPRPCTLHSARPR